MARTKKNKLIKKPTSRQIAQDIIKNKHSDKIKEYTALLCLNGCINFDKKKGNCGKFLIPVTLSGDKCPYFINE